MYTTFKEKYFASKAWISQRVDSPAKKSHVDKFVEYLLGSNARIKTQEV